MANEIENERDILDKLKIMQDIREAVEELKLVKTGNLVARDADELVNELKYKT